MDLSQDGHTEVIFVDEDNNILAADVYGCHCRTLLKATSDRPTGWFTSFLLGLTFFCNKNMALRNRDDFPRTINLRCLTSFK